MAGLARKFFGRAPNMRTVFELLLFTCSTAAASLILSGQTLDLDGISYYLPPEPFTVVSAFPVDGLYSAGGLVPVTVVGTSDMQINQDRLSTIIEEYGKLDDIWNPGFLTGACQ